MDKDSLKPILEAIIFASEPPVSIDRIMNILEGERRDEVKAALKDMLEEFKNSQRGIFLEEVAGGYQFRTRPEFASWIKKLFKIGPQKLSKPSMETLAMIAYKQPITRMEIEELRGVDTGGVLKTLMDRNLIKVIGRKEVPGRPAVYGTTKEFLEVFDLKDLSSLPTLKEIRIPEEEEFAGEITEDNSQGRDSIQTGSRADDSGEQSHSQQPDSNKTGDQG